MHSDTVHFNIKEVAEQIGVVPATIRNWEKQGLFRAKRGKNRYRVFDFKDIELLRRLKECSKDENMGIKAIRMLYSHEERRAAPEAGSVSKKLLGKKWREHRVEKGYALEDVAKAVGISPSYLSKIENAETKPNVSLGVLLRLAEYYEENLLYYLNDDADEQPLIKKNCGDNLPIGIAGVTVKSLASRKNMIISPMLYTIAPGIGRPEASKHTGEEFIHVLRGSLTFFLNGAQEYRLSAGDSLSFHSREPHRWINSGSHEAVLLWIYVPVAQNRQEE